MLVSTEIEKLERRWQENPRGLAFAPLAEAYRKGGEVSKALELLDTGLAQHPGYVPAHIVRGRCHLDAGERSLAELDFLCVVELDPENVIALQGLADLAEGEGRASDAILRLEALLVVDRNNEEAQVQLARLQEESVVAPLSSPELRVRNDSETLRPSGQPLQGIEILDIESNLPAAPAEPPKDGLPKVPEEVVELPAEVPVSAAEAQPPADELPSLPQELEPVAELQSEAPAQQGASVEPQPEPAQEPEPELEPEGEPVAEEPELVVTETMAEIFLRQGHRELALAVYTQLLLREPENHRIAAAVAELGGRSPAAASEAPVAPSAPARRYDASSTGGRSVAEFLAALLSAPRPSPTAKAVHPPAFESKRAPAEPEPNQPAPSFDEFFAPPAGSRATAPRATDTGFAENPRAEDAEDMEQFNAWLRGLKR